MTDQSSARHKKALARHKKALHAALEPAIAAGRAALRDLDDDEIPNRLRKVAAATGKRLPPPLATTLLMEIDGSEWFREQVAERLPDDTEPIARVFVARAEGWWRVVVEAVASEIEAQHDAAHAELVARNDRLTMQLAEAKQRAARDGKEDGGPGSDIEEQLRQSRARLRELQRERTAADDAAAAAVAALHSQMAAETKQRQELERSLEEVRGRLHRTRRERRDEGRSDGGTRSLPSDPVAMARAVDLQVAMLAKAGDSAAATGKRPQDALRLPPGMRPDTAEALRWLAACDPPVLFVVDGYNVLFHVDNDRARAGQARGRMNDALRRLRRQSASRPGFTVVYDSAVQGERRSRNTVEGIEIRFAPEGTSADDEVIRLAGESARVVVISSDREVQEGASAAGAVVVWSEALAELMQA